MSRRFARSNNYENSPLISRSKPMSTTSMMLGVGITLFFATTVLFVALYATKDTGPKYIGMDVINVLLDAPDIFSVGDSYSMPPDTISAVGDHSIVSMTNAGHMIFKKTTLEQIAVSDGEEIDSDYSGDPHIVWDQESKRFFYTQFSTICACDGYLDFDDSLPGFPNPVCGRQPQGDFVPVTVPITGLVVQPIPADGCSAFTNGGAMAGNIAIVEFGGACGSSQKVDNAEAAGAIAIIIHDGDGYVNDCFFGFTGVGTPTNIPMINMGSRPGVELVASLPNTVTITPSDVLSVTAKMGVAASKTADPQSFTSADWEYFVIGPPTYPAIEFADYPKIAVDSTQIYITTQNFIGDDVTGENSRQQIVAIDKADVMNGNGATISFNKFINGTENMFPFPVENIASSEPYNRQYFISYNGNPDRFGNNVVTYPTSIRILRTHPTIPDGPLTVTDIPFGEGLPTLRSTRQAAEQPRGSITGKESQSIPAFTLPMTGVRQGNSLWFAHTYQSESTGTDDDSDGTYNEDLEIILKPRPGRSVVRWYEYDISRDLAEDIITLKQWGDVIPEDGESGLSMPSISVDVDGNMAIGFTISGPHLLHATAYTGRHSSDPLGTTRYPIIIASQAHVPFDPEELFGVGEMRWGDYSKVNVDPVDGRTFYVHGMRSNSDPEELNAAGDASVTWTTDIATFKFEALDYAPQTETVPKRTIGSSVEDLLEAAHNAALSPEELESRRRNKKREVESESEFAKEHRMIPFGPRCHQKEVNGQMSAKCKKLEERLGTDTFMKGPARYRKER